MTEADRTQLLEIAEFERTRLEDLQYHRADTYPCDKLTNMCYLSAYCMSLSLRANGYRPTIHRSHYHAFCVVRRMIVDVTATQFGYRRIVLEPRNSDVADAPHWHSIQSFGSPRTFRTWCRAKLFVDW